MQKLIGWAVCKMQESMSLEDGISKCNALHILVHIEFLRQNRRSIEISVVLLNTSADIFVITVVILHVYVIVISQY